MVAEKELQTFSAFEGKVSGNSIKGISLIQEGPALGHGVWIDSTMLSQVRKLAAGSGRVKAKLNHWSGIQDNIGYYENFRIRGGKLLADLTLYESHPGREHLLEMIETIPASFGVSIMFQPDEAQYDKDADRYNARAKELYSADFVDTPAANRDGVFTAKIDNSEDDMANTAPITPPADAFDAAAEIASLKAQLAAFVAKQSEPAPVAPKADDTIPNLAAQFAALADEVKAFAKARQLAPEPSTPVAPPSEPAKVEPAAPDTAFEDARTEAIGDAKGFERARRAMAFDFKYPTRAEFTAKHPTK